MKSFSVARKACAAALLVLCTGTALVVYWRSQRGAGEFEYRLDSRGGHASAEQRQPQSPSNRAPNVGAISDVEADQAFRATELALQEAQGSSAVEQALAALRLRLGALGPERAAAVIIEYLRSGRDAATHSEMALGAGGSLKQAPTLRVYLLDLLGRLDASRAAQYGESVFQAHNSADEWAIALRNYAWANTNKPEASVLLQERLRDLLHYQPWSSEPSVGFLQAFDVAAYAGMVELLPDLAELLRHKENPAVAHAAYLAIDRLAVQDPALLLAKLQSDPALLEGREQTRANYFARGDVEDPRQEQVIEAYLLDPVRSEEELRAFAGLFPSANYSISNNLLTTNATPKRTKLARRDRATLETVERWQKDPRFARVQPYLEQIAERLRHFYRRPSVIRTGVHGGGQFKAKRAKETFERRKVWALKSEAELCDVYPFPR